MSILQMLSVHEFQYAKETFCVCVCVEQQMENRAVQYIIDKIWLLHTSIQCHFKELRTSKMPTWRWQM